MNLNLEDMIAQQGRKVATASNAVAELEGRLKIAVDLLERETDERKRLEELFKKSDGKTLEVRVVFGSSSEAKDPEGAFMLLKRIGVVNPKAVFVSHEHLGGGSDGGNSWVVVAKVSYVISE